MILAAGIVTKCLVILGGVLFIGAMAFALWADPDSDHWHGKR